MARLQVGGLTLEDLRRCPTAADVVVHLNPHAEMTTGKAAAQVGHAAQLVLQSLQPTPPGGSPRAPRSPS